MRAIKLLLITLAIVPAVSSAATKPPPAKKLCVGSDGALTLRGRCKKTEKVSSLASLLQAAVPVNIGAPGAQGPKGTPGGKGLQGDNGPKGGVSVTECRVVTQFGSNIFPDPAAEPTVVTVAQCDPATEFMMTYAYNANAAVAPVTPNQALRAIVWAHDLRSSSGVAYGVDVTATRIVTSSAYVLSVKAICCPKA